MFWQVLLIGILDSAIAAVGFQSLFKWSLTQSIVFCVLSVALHWGVYWLIARRRTREWGKPKFEKSLSDSKT
jgi:hypothetical protein